jgi:hypothetical protein
VRSVALAIVLFAQPFFGAYIPHTPEQVRVAWTKPDPQYPLKVRVLTSDRHGHVHAGIVLTDSYGSGNLWGDPMVGFDYSSHCEGGFMHNESAGEFYQGKWKTQDRKIEILTMEPGRTYSEKCTIDVTLKPAPYSKENPPPKLVTAH